MLERFNFEAEDEKIRLRHKSAAFAIFGVCVDNTVSNYFKLDRTDIFRIWRKLKAFHSWAKPRNRYTYFENCPQSYYNFFQEKYNRRRVQQLIISRRIWHPSDIIITYGVTVLTVLPWKTISNQQQIRYKFIKSTKFGKSNEIRSLFNLIPKLNQKLEWNRYFVKICWKLLQKFCVD